METLAPGAAINVAQIIKEIQNKNILETPRTGLAADVTEVVFVEVEAKAEASKQTKSLTQPANCKGTT
jgi:hypothetical protein